MALMEAILHRVHDQETVTDRMEKSTALRELVEGYQRLTYDDATLPTITSVTTGAELKLAIRQLPAEVQLNLLKKYSDTVHGVQPSEPPEKIEERRHRHWLFKMMSLVASSILLILVVSLVSVLFRGGDTTNTNVIASVFSTTVEIVKLIFTGNK